MSGTFRWLIVAALFCDAATVSAQQPVLTDDRLVLEVVAEAPEVVTPTGITVDEQGRVWVIENHTHHRPANYQGPTSDRIRVFSDFDDYGKARQIATFLDGFKDSMSLAFGPDGSLYFATRREIFLLPRQDLKAGEKRSLIKLQTKGDYPHNGLCGFAFDALGNMYFGIGENLGADYKLIGSDGTTLTGGGEGGNMFRCRPDGSKLVRVATGFWNPFHHCVDGYGRLFAVDNDPDSRGPCRLLHVVDGGDYGFKFRYGRKGLHPFQSWAGELPGTLGFVAGTGEAPSGMVAYESTGLPADYRGKLLSTSWGDHILERFELVPSGASFAAKPSILARGKDNFRPVGIAVGPDGAVYLSDWVDKSYPVHGKGRIWRIRMKKPAVDDGLRASKVAAMDVEHLGKLLDHPKIEIRTAATLALAKKGTSSNEVLTAVLKENADVRAKLQALWAAKGADAKSPLVETALGSTAPEVRAEAARLLPDTEAADALRLQLVRKDASAMVRMQALASMTHKSALTEVVPFLADADPFLVSAALHALGRPGQADLLLAHIDAPNPRLRLGVLLALRKTGDAKGRSALEKFLKDADPEIRRTSIQWVGEEMLKEYAEQINSAATQVPVTPELFKALMASRHLLAGGKADAEPIDEKVLAKVVHDGTQPTTFRVLAMQMLRPENAALAAGKVGEFLTSKEPTLRRQTSRMLALRADKPSQELLLKLAGDNEAEQGMRADAVAGLAHSAPGSAEAQQLLLSLLEKPALRRDSLRSLRGAMVRPEVVKSLLEWWDKAADDKERKELADQLLLDLKSVQTPEIEKRLKPLAELAGTRPQTEPEWQRFLQGSGDAAAGEQVFFHANGPRCYTCHRVDGRGGRIGPDLSTIARAMNRDKLIESILTPSKEIAPMFVAWTFTTRDGKVRTGVVVDEGFDSTITIGDAQGKLEVLKRQDIEDRVALPTSLMPDKLHEQMTLREFLDLLAYLLERK